MIRTIHLYAGGIDHATLMNKTGDKILTELTAEDIMNRYRETSNGK